MAFDRDDPADLAALKSEVDTDPLGIGYNASSGDVGNIVDLINEKNYTVTKTIVSSSEIRGVTSYEAFNALAQDEQEWLMWLAPGSDDDMVVTADVRLQLCGETGGGGSNSSIWANAQRSAMETAMLALIDVAGSRAEVLFGYNTIIRQQDYTAARDS
jgi:hypothetical protein